MCLFILRSTYENTLHSPNRLICEVVGAVCLLKFGRPKAKLGGSNLSFKSRHGILTLAPNDDFPMLMKFFGPRRLDPLGLPSGMALVINGVPRRTIMRSLFVLSAPSAMRLWTAPAEQGCAGSN